MMAYIFWFVIALCHPIHSGFIAGTLVKVPTGYKTIESIHVGDTVCTMKGQTSEVVSTVSYYGPHIVRIVFKESFLDTSAQQKLYTFPQHMWTKACSLSSVDSAYSNRFGGIEACIKDIQIIHQEMQFFDIRLKEHHAFYVTEQEILVHNFPLCFLNVAFSWGLGKIAFEGAYVGICCAGVWIGTKILKKGSGNGSSQRYTIKPTVSYGSPTPDPDDDECKNKHPHGLYVESPKHHMHSRGRISKPPRDGQAALDNSFKIGNGPHRVAIEDKNIVILRQERIKQYHGYILNTKYECIPPNIRNVLLRHGLISKNGRIL